LIFAAAVAVHQGVASWLDSDSKFFQMRFVLWWGAIIIAYSQGNAVALKLLQLATVGVYARNLQHATDALRAF
jgi:hypothetical protein